MSSPTLKGFVPLDTNALYEFLGKSVEEIEALDSLLPSEVLFPEINVGGIKSTVGDVNKVQENRNEVQLKEVKEEVEQKAGVVFVQPKEVKKEVDFGESANTCNSNGGLQKDIYFDKYITKSRKKGNQVLHFPAEVIKKAIRPDITSCTMLDLETNEHYDCKIIKSKRQYVEMYLADGWYDFAKSKKLKVGDKLICHYDSEKEILGVKVETRYKKKCT